LPWFGGLFKQKHTHTASRFWTRAQHCDLEKIAVANRKIEILDLKARVWLVVLAQNDSYTAVEICVCGAHSSMLYHDEEYM
jgi:hypothetical protein